MYILRTLIGFCITINCSPAFSQWGWVDSSVGNSFERVTGVAVDETNDVIYSVGYFEGNPNFPEINSSFGGEDGFVMKYNLAGSVIWAFKIGGSNDDRVTSVAVDPTTGNVFTTGFIEGSFSSNNTTLAGTSGGTSSAALASTGGKDAFVACYNSSGQLLWYKLIGGSGVDQGFDIAVNSTGVFATGFYTNYATINLVSTAIPVNGKINNFVIALNKSNGNTLWNTVLGSSVDDFTVPSNNETIKRMGISADNTGVYLNTYFSGSSYAIYNASGSLATTIVDPNSSSLDIVITSYTNNGSHNWSVLYNDIGSVLSGMDVTTDCSGVYVSGTLHDNGVTAGGVVINSDHDNFFIAKLDKSNGTELWLQEFDSEFYHDDHFLGLAADGYGNLYATGRLRGTGVELGNVLDYSGGQNYNKVMIAHFYTDGTFKSFEVLPGSDDAWGMSIATYKDEKYVLGGYYNGTINFGTNTPNNNGDNGFIALRSLATAPMVYTSPAGNATFCQSQANPVPVLNIPSGGTFTAPPEIVFENLTTGEINLTSSTAGGPYTITYTTSAQACNAATVDFQITIVSDDASFAYTSDHFCQNESNPVPASITTSGGTFSATGGLVLANSSTGEIDVAGSTPGGPYTLLYSTSGACPASHTAQIYIDAVPDSYFDYAQASYCTGVGVVSPTINTPGGSFVWPVGIDVVSSTLGQINIDASTPGSAYPIQYTVSTAYCQSTSTFDLTIIQTEDPTFTFASSHFCNNEANPVPSSIATYGGTFSGPMAVNSISGEIDLNASAVGGPYWLVYSLNGTCPVSDSIEIYLEAAPDSLFAYAQSSYCTGVGIVTPSVNTTGGTFTWPAGISVVDPSIGKIDIDNSVPGGPYSIQYTLTTAYCQSSSSVDLTINETEEATFTYATDHFCQNEVNPLPTSITTPGGTFYAVSGLVLTNTLTGEIDVEASTPGGPFTLTYTTNSLTCPDSDELQVFIEAAPDPSFTFSESSYCAGSGTVVPNTIVTTGGTFSGPAQVVFVDPSTGEIDLNASVIGGPYTIQYQLSNSFCQESATFDVTINGQDSVESLTYGSNKFCVIDENQSATVVGTSGGVFSAELGIDLLSSSTGLFSPQTSSLGGPYRMSYVSPGTCPDSAEFYIFISDLLIADAGEDQVLDFSFSTQLDAEDPISGVGIWTMATTSQITDALDSKSMVSNLNKGINTFTWTVSDQTCPTVSDEVIIEVLDLFIPEAVTPNNDGKNDFFELVSIVDVTCDLQIFNRWGQVVYENKNYQNEWYGQNSKGEELSNDTYFYVILINDAISYNGYVVLKK